MIESFIKYIPDELINKSGAVFYSGRNAFSGNKDLYVLGLNPGGSPDKQFSDTIKSSIKQILENKAYDWSAYRDELWGKVNPGTWGMQPRVLHLFSNLGLNPGDIPSSNIIFVRSQREINIRKDADQLSEYCWPFHRAVIEELKPKAILCFGKTAGNLVRKKLAADRHIDEFIETNKRNWKSQAFISIEGVKVIVATHPSIADWTSADTDPSPMIKRVINNK
ncbi:MAG: uracil-DNA glycosylase family protein [Desulfurivibrionaceae bacterium]